MALPRVHAEKTKDATQAELDDCVELDVVTHTAGDI